MTSWQSIRPWSEQNSVRGWRPLTMMAAPEVQSHTYGIPKAWGASCPDVFVSDRYHTGMGLPVSLTIYRISAYNVVYSCRSNSIGMLFAYAVIRTVLLGCSSAQPAHLQTALFYLMSLSTLLSPLGLNLGDYVDRKGLKSGPEWLIPQRCFITLVIKVTPNSDKRLKYLIYKCLLLSHFTPHTSTLVPHFPTHLQEEVHWFCSVPSSTTLHLFILFL